MKVNKIGYINSDNHYVGELNNDRWNLLANSNPEDPVTAIFVNLSSSEGMHSKPIPILIPVAK